ncbi:hypothetical protein VTI74DRAFT_860 [Chaetomium olivicolor]
MSLAIDDWDRQRDDIRVAHLKQKPPVHAAAKPPNAGFTSHAAPSTMVVRYDPVDHADDGNGNHPPASSTSFHPDTASPLSPTSQPTSTSLVSPRPSPSPVPYVSLAEQTFTPLSMDASDFSLSDTMGTGKASPGVLEAKRLLSKARSMEHLRRDGNLSRSSSNSTVPTAGQGATIVSAMVESFEALHASKTASNGYELLRSKSHDQRPAGLVSPPSTLSHSPSLSRSPSPFPALKTQGLNADTGLGTAGQKTPIAAQDENNTAPQTAVTTQHTDPPAPNSNASHAQTPSKLPPPASSTADAPRPATAVTVADTPLIRPTPSSRPQTQDRAISSSSRHPIVRTSSTASLSLNHPTPDPNKLSQAGGLLGNIAVLEATAERLSMTSSIEDAIREEHNELKRTESRRSSILRARAASTSDSGSIHGQSQLSVASRQNSILGINNAARTGGYSPGGYIMNPHHSLTSTSGRLRSSSKASSLGMPPHIPETGDMATPTDHAQEFRYMPRHGPGKASTRSVTSKMSLAQIAELEPTALTQAALDEADRATAAGKFPEDEERIRASAHQFIEAEFADAIDVSQPMLSYGVHEPQSPRLQLHQPDQYQPYGGHYEEERPTTSGSGTTFEQAQAAFGDFDGVHCDPDADQFAAPEPQRHPPQTPRHPPPAPRPTSYFDPATGQQMLYYPAPVPAMLNLPPKLSKKPNVMTRDMRRTQVMSALPKASRESRVWLPDPTKSLRGSQDAPFIADFLGESGAQDVPADPVAAPPEMEAGTQPHSAHARQASEASTIHPPAEQREMRRPQRLKDAENRKSRPMTLEGLPPQLRASAFFDLPSETPKIKVKDGSAMDTLDSLLDASTVAPVSAFTDHVFAGKLGAEVYGPEKTKKKSKKSMSGSVVVPEEKAAKRKTLVKRNSSGNLLEPDAEEKPKRKTLVKRNSSANLLDPSTEKKQASRFSIFGPKRTADDDPDDDSRSGSHIVDSDKRSRRSASPNQLAPDTDEETEEEEEEHPVYQGPPTTLLAELQLRKQQNKLRTRPVQHVYPEGMRSTLLELDAVAEVERKARHGKRVTLAWEDPAAKPQDSDEDEDVPLGMLYAAKAAGAAGNRSSTMDISALMSEVHRPLGLMERREMEENEPLSRRRDRLHGKVTEQLPTSLAVLQKRMTMIPAGEPGSGLRSQSRLALPLPQSAGSRAGSMLGSRPGSAAGEKANAAEESDPEIEGETLAARKARLAAENPLPRPRPVSGAFSAELLREFGPEDEPDKDKTHSRNPSATSAKENAPPQGEVHIPEEEETLGQRRRRLQREREAREREMAFSTLNRAATPLGLKPNPPAGGPNLGPTFNANLNSNLNPNFNSNVNMNTIRPVTANPASAVPRPTLGLADVLSSTRHPSMMHMTMDPREQERLRREAEAVRVQREMDAKMAMLRSQMPQSLTTPNVGARTGGYMGGRFNDGWGGGQVGGGQSLGYGGQGNLGLLGGGVTGTEMQGQQQRANTLLGVPGLAMGQGVYGGSTPNLGVYQQQGNGMGGYGMQVGGQGDMGMVERWRQGVMP